MRFRNYHIFLFGLAAALAIKTQCIQAQIDSTQVVVYFSQCGGSANCPSMSGYYYLYFPCTNIRFTGELIQAGPIYFSPGVDEGLHHGESKIIVLG